MDILKRGGSEGGRIRKTYYAARLQWIHGKRHFITLSRRPRVEEDLCRLWLCWFVRNKTKKTNKQFLPSRDEGRRKTQGKGCLCVLTVFPLPSDRGNETEGRPLFPIMRARHVSYRFVE